MNKPLEDKCPSYQIGISPNARRVVVNGTRIELSDVESALLSCLTAHSGEAVSRSRLRFAMRAAAQGKPLPDRAVDFGIRRLRLKLEPEARRPRLLVTVRGQGYRYVPPPRSDARARRVGPATGVARRLANALSRACGLVQVLGGRAPDRSGLVRAVVDEMGGSPEGGVVWVGGRFSDAEALSLAVSAACGSGHPIDVDTGELLATRASTVMVIDGVVEGTPTLLNRIREWRDAAPAIRWVVMASTPLDLARDATHDLGTPDLPAKVLSSLSRDGQRLLCQLVGSPGPIDVRLLMGEKQDDRAVEELDRLGLVRVSGRGSARQAGLCPGLAPAVRAAMPVAVIRSGQTLSRHLATTLVPEPDADAPWELLLPSHEVMSQAARHHPLLMEAVAECSGQRHDLARAVSAHSIMCVGLPRVLMRTWLHGQGEHLLQRPGLSAGLRALAHLSLAALDLPIQNPVLLNDPTGRVSVPQPSTGAEDHIDAAAHLAERYHLDHVYAATLSLRAALLSRQGAGEDAQHAAQAAMIEHQAGASGLGVAATALLLAEHHARTGDVARCARALGNAVPRLETSGRPTWAARAQAALGRYHALLGDDLSARHHLESALVHARVHDALHVLAVAATSLAVIEQRAGMMAEARLRWREAVRAMARLGDPRVGTGAAAARAWARNTR